MRITISGKNIELTEGLKQAVEEKLSKLEKFFKPDTDMLSVQSRSAAICTYQLTS
jgi:putative sigma-54 modulation protein